MVTPLRKKDLKGQLYTRTPENEALLAQLEALPKTELVLRCEILSDKNPQYVPSECVLYFLRTDRNSLTNALFERLYKVLIGRLLRQLPSASTSESENMFSTMVRDKARDTFCERLTLDIMQDCNHLDYFEIRFASAVASLRKDAYRDVKREQDRRVAIESEDEDVSEFSIEIETAAGSYDPFDTENYLNINYRFALLEAIEELPDLQRRIIQMIMKDIPIYSEKDSVLTISKVLGKSDKTIRTQRDKAYKKLQFKLEGN